jgi:hypothetical protein
MRKCCFASCFSILSTIQYSGFVFPNPHILLIPTTYFDGFSCHHTKGTRWDPNRTFGTLRKKWVELPFGQMGQQFSTQYTRNTSNRDHLFECARTRVGGAGLQMFTNAMGAGSAAAPSWLLRFIKIHVKVVGVSFWGSRAFPGSGTPPLSNRDANMQSLIKAARARVGCQNLSLC